MNHIVFTFFTLGVLFMFFAALGILRMPDLYCRLQTASKASTLGVVFLAIGAGLHFYNAGYLKSALFVSVLFLLTSPVAAHILGLTARKTWGKNPQSSPDIKL